MHRREGAVNSPLKIHKTAEKMEILTSQVECDACYKYRSEKGHFCETGNRFPDAGGVIILTGK